MTITFKVLAAFVASTWYTSGFDGLMLAVQVITSILTILGGIVGGIILAMKWMDS